MKEIDIVCEVVVFLDELIIKYDPDRQSYEITLEQSDGKSARIFDVKSIVFTGYKVKIVGKALLEEGLGYGTL